MDAIKKQLRWDVLSIDFESIKFSTWGIEDKQLERLVFFLRNTEVKLQSPKIDKITFSDLKTIVAWLHKHGYDTSDLNKAIRQALGAPHIQTWEEFKDAVEALYSRTPITVHDDLQKNRWGGKSLFNKYELTATVENDILPGYYNVEAKVVSNDKTRPLKGNVAFFLHDTFSEEIEYVEAKDGVATYRMKHCYEAFTFAVYLEDGTTLELDLNEIQGYPEGFYWQDMTDFQSSVKAMYDRRPIMVKDDLQKNRWGSKNENNNKRLEATVWRSWIPKYFAVHLQIISTHPDQFTGEAAYFLHNTFGREIRFVRVRNGVAGLRIKAYEAFTVGAYTQDGTMLELDLNEVDGFPNGFYYGKRKKK